MTTTTRGALCALAITPLLAAGCGSSDKKSSSSSGGSSSTAAPKSKPFKVGYSLPTGQNPFLNAIEAGAEKTIQQAGGTVTKRDGQLDPNKQVSDINEFINDGVDAIIIGPAQVPEAVTPVVKRAVKAGIKVFAWDWDFSGEKSGAAPKGPVQGTVDGDRTTVGIEIADQLKKSTGGKAKVIYVGLPFPVTGTDQFFSSMKAQLAKTGGKIVQRVDNGKDNAEGARPLVDGALTAHGDANAIVTYNGGSALGAYQAAKAAGRKLEIIDAQVDPAAIVSQRKGQISRQWELDPVQNGVELGKLATAAAQGKPASDWKKTVIVPSHQVDKSNVAKWVSWDKQLAALK